MDSRNRHAFTNLMARRLFFAVPELTFNFKIVDSLKAMGIISAADYSRYKAQRRYVTRAQKIAGAAMTGENLIKRLVNVAPELINEDVIDILAGITWDQQRVRIDWTKQDDELRYLQKTKKMSLISPSQAHIMRLALRTMTAATRGGLPSDAAQVAKRVASILGVNLSNERIDLWLSLGLIDRKEAARYRGYLMSGWAVKESVLKALRAKKFLDAFLLIGGIGIDEKFINGLVKADLLNASTAGSYLAFMRLGVKEWKVFSGSSIADGYRSRLALVLTGSMNRQLLDLLYELKIIDGKTWSMLQPLEIISRRVNDQLLESFVRRRFRVKPGEPPIRTFARASRVSEEDLLRLLAASAQEARKEAAALAALDGVGASTRSRQYRLAAAGLHQSMRAMWEGVGYMSIWGEREAAEAAAESMNTLERTLLKGDYSKLADSLLWQSKAGIDSYISREENTLALSRKVYKNIALHTGKVDQRIAMSLLQGKGPQEIATDVFKYINPNTPGGASYAAKRLARTEINNAFHLSTIRFTRESPWVRGYQWNRSSSHGSKDICDEYANEDHDGLGNGVFKKANVPGKPHPHCLCYITTVQMSEAEFVAAFNAGRFKSFLKTVDAVSTFSAPTSGSVAAYARQGFGNFAENLKRQ